VVDTRAIYSHPKALQGKLPGLLSYRRLRRLTVEKDPHWGTVLRRAIVMARPRRQHSSAGPMQAEPVNLVRRGTEQP